MTSSTKTKPRRRGTTYIERKGYINIKEIKIGVRTSSGHEGSNVERKRRITGRENHRQIDDPATRASGCVASGTTDDSDEDEDDNDEGAGMRVWAVSGAAADSGGAIPGGDGGRGGANDSDAMLDTVRGWLPPPQPPDPSSSIEPQPPAILASTLENATAKVAKIAARYGYHSPSNHPENEGTSSLDSAVFLLLPVRISLSLYLTPSFARVMHRAACRLRKPDPHKPSPPSSGTS
ncbi:hypothetical protein PCANC_04135 [Puccinia coronata f. sp. avenae]|uniref:Uncharacterized protein n=1 Tax=Puccinia coronata f. sp. avenae TaxID=200324 RepID=A0A2N5W777_9BASI|nr:hypothetical protein PCANC_04135 [Puccinia coronata f. sp. avenae]